MNTLYILDGILNTYVMISLWFGVIGVISFVAYKTKLYGILVVAAGGMPYLIFYVYKLFNVWDTGLKAILYSRLASVSLCVSVILAVWLMYRSQYDESKQSADF